MKKVLIVDDIEAWINYNSTQISEILNHPEITVANSAREAYDKIIENSDKPFDIVITDMQMESDFEPKHAGEWLIEKIKDTKSYLGTKIIIISGAYNVRTIAKLLNVDCIPKSTAINFPDIYKEVLNIN